MQGAANWRYHQGSWEVLIPLNRVQVGQARVIRVTVHLRRGDKRIGDGVSQGNGGKGWDLKVACSASHAYRA